MYDTVLIPVDLAHSESLPLLVGTAQELMNDGSQVAITILYVDDSLVHKAGSPQVDSAFEAGRRRDTKDRLLALVKNLLPESLDCRCHVRHGTVHETILDEARQIRADVIVMMAQKPGLSSYFVGSNAERVVRHSRCSVMVVRDN